MGLLRKIQDARLYGAAYTAGEETGVFEGYLKGWEAGNDVAMTGTAMHER